VPQSCIFVDDAFSGAEFRRRQGGERLRAALKPRPSFQVLIVSEQSRLSRDTADTLQVLKELARAGVRVFAYQDDRPISLDTRRASDLRAMRRWHRHQRRGHDLERRQCAVTPGTASAVRRVGGFDGADGVASGVVPAPDGLESHGEKERVRREAAHARLASARRVASPARKGSSGGVPHAERWWTRRRWRRSRPMSYGRPSWSAPCSSPWTPWGPIDPTIDVVRSDGS
jgi:hypothetical protein